MVQGIPAPDKPKTATQLDEEAALEYLSAMERFATDGEKLQLLGAVISEDFADIRSDIMDLYKKIVEIKQGNMR